MESLNFASFNVKKLAKNTQNLNLRCSGPLLNVIDDIDDKFIASWECFAAPLRFIKTLGNNNKKHLVTTLYQVLLLNVLLQSYNITI